MLIVETAVFVLGAYRVQQRPRPDNPGFAVYLVFRGPKLVGKQFSRPCESDCQWLEREGRVYATESKSVDMLLINGVHRCIVERRYLGGQATRRRGRPRKDEVRREVEEEITT